MHCFIIGPKLNTIRWKLCSIFDCVGPFGGRLRHHETSTSSRRRAIRHTKILFHRWQTVLVKMNNTTTTGGVRTHADICPLDLKSNALTTRPPCCRILYIIYKIYVIYQIVPHND
ncbi:hypothetical protein T10_5311 [Trichinella papuae]|uniref:Uncharacterized protein n=1 Tax=Trichinella papuae TaxID=268474 RepID=A0A0V1MWF3_9BILA|nr:hypothetical protein T10_5311 [Trichinella papuae]